MDRMLYIAMSGAKETAFAQTSNSHNLANANTTGFRAALDVFETRPVVGPVFDSRSYIVREGKGIDFTHGPLQSTGRELDVAIRGEGWIAVQAPDGTEAYTRAGDLRVDALGQLSTGTGLPVLGDAGPIALPPFESLLIGNDGTISIRPLGAETNALANVDRIKLVLPDNDDLYRGEDGLIRHVDGEPLEPDAAVTLVHSMLEASNVNTVESLVTMIELSRHFEMQVKMMKTAEENDSASASLLRMS